jgi:hypothetical protein
MNSDNSFRQTLETAKDEMARLLRERKVIDDRLSKLAPLVDYLSALCDPTPLETPVPSASDVGLSDAIRFAFRSGSPRLGLTATDVRDNLRENGFHLDKYANELPPIHNTIARLEKAGEIELVLRPDGAKAHRWVSGLKRAILEMENNRIVSTLSDTLANPPMSAAAIATLGFGLPDDRPQDSKEMASLPPPPSPEWIPPSGNRKGRK